MTIEEFKKLAIDSITYGNINLWIDELFPEYLKSELYYDVTNKDLPYAHLGNLSSLVFEELDNRTDTELAERLLEMTNYVVNNFGDIKNEAGTDDLGNLFGIEVYEQLCGYKKGAQLAKKYLFGKALQSFHNTTMHYNTDEFLEEYFQVFEIHPITSTDPEALYTHMWNDLQWPAMNSPEVDSLLWDIRTNLELDEDLIAGTLSYIASGKTPPEIQMKNFWRLQKSFRGYRSQISQHKVSEKNQNYARELLTFIDDLERISPNADLWMWTNLLK